jgi:hypothetical protein
MAQTRVEDEDAQPSRCWCRGGRIDGDRVVPLGHHPEVGVCPRCARSIGKWGGEIEDRDHHGVAVHVRDQMRRLRRTVVASGWHHRPLVGRGLRRLGRWTP